jgi:co-chaperonin GroES (HSP10)
MTPIFDPDITSGGLYVPDMAKERCDQGIIKYVGPKVLWAQIGWHVLFSGYSGTYMSIEDEGKLLMMPENYLMLRILPETTEVPGLYFKGRDGVHFPATYEMAMEIIADAFHEAPWFRKMKELGVSSGTTKDKRDFGHSERFTFSGHSNTQLDPNADVTDPDLEGPEFRRDTSNLPR